MEGRVKAKSHVLVNANKTLTKKKKTFTDTTPLWFMDTKAILAFASKHTVPSETI